MRINPPWLAWPQTQALAQAIAPLRFVGGCVRDAVLNRSCIDIDAATPLLPAQVMEQLKAAGIKAIPTGIDHGTVTALIDGRHFEITTLRRDVSTDGRHATVAFTEKWREDAARRDFTMNALYCDAQGEVFDYFGGMKDAAEGHVRFIGDVAQRIREDALRILRFFRFFAHYGHGPTDTEGLKACSAEAALIDTLSGERIQQEMLKLLVADKAAQVVDLMQRHGILAHVVLVPVKTDALSRAPQILHKAEHAPDALLSLALLLRTIPENREAIADSIAQRWKLSKAQHKQLQALCMEGNQWQSGEKEWRKTIRAWGKGLFIERMLIAMAEGADAASAQAAIALARTWEIPLFPVTGDDLVQRGMKPGKELGYTLQRLESLWEEGGYTAGKEELLAALE